MLFVFGSGPVRGFAVTITVGIITSLFTATMLVRLLMVRWYATLRPVALAGLGQKNVQPPAVSPVPRQHPHQVHARPLHGADRLGGAVHRLGDPLLLPRPAPRHRFLRRRHHGGTHSCPADFAAIRAALAAQGVVAPGVQRFGDANDVAIRLGEQPGEGATQVMVNKVRAALDQAQPGSRILRTDAVGASVSAELFRNGMLSFRHQLVDDIVYIWFRFEWQFAVGAVVTLCSTSPKRSVFSSLRASSSTWSWSARF